MPQVFFLLSTLLPRGHIFSTCWLPSTIFKRLGALVETFHIETTGLTSGYQKVHGTPLTLTSSGLYQVSTSGDLISHTVHNP